MRKIMRNYSEIQLYGMVENFYYNYGNGKSIKDFRYEFAIRQKCSSIISILILEKFLKITPSILHDTSSSNLRRHDRYISLRKYKKGLDIGYVYCIGVGSNIKIGRTCNMIKRMASYKSHSGVEPNIHVVKVCIHHKKEESLLKKYLNSGSKINNEWFDKNRLDDIKKHISV